MCLIDILKTTRTQLQDRLARILVDDRRHDSPEALSRALRRAYEEASVVFATLRGHDVPVEVVPHLARGTVIISANSGQIVLGRSLREGWVSVQLGLSGEHLARYLSEWPAFHLPTEPGANVNRALSELRSLLGVEGEVDVERVAEIADAHISPLVHDYIHRHRLTWTPARCWAFEQRQRRRFAERGIQLLEQQTRAQLLAAVQSDREGDAVALAEALNAVVGPASQRWGAVLGFTVEVVATALSDGTVVVSDPWDYDAVVFAHGDGTWRPSWGEVTLEGALGAILTLIQTEPVEGDPDSDDTWGDDDWFEEREEGALEERHQSHYWLLQDRNVLHERPADELLEEEEHWRVQMYFRGLARGQRDSADRF